MPIYWAESIRSELNTHKFLIRYMLSSFILTIMNIFLLLFIYVDLERAYKSQVRCNAIWFQLVVSAQGANALSSFFITLWPTARASWFSWLFLLAICNTPISPKLMTCHSWLKYKQIQIWFLSKIENSANNQQQAKWREISKQMPINKHPRDQR